MARSRAWHIVAPVNAALVVFVLFFASLRLARPGTVFYYAEGPVLGSLAALESAGDLSALYPADGWVEPPVVLTLYPPVYFLAAQSIDDWLGNRGAFTGLRLVSALALCGLLGLLTLHSVRRRSPPAWILALTAAALMTPAVYRVAGGAQADSLALLLTWVGITAAVGTTGSRVRQGALPLLAAGAAFLFAFFSKQSFISAPAALTIALWLGGRRRAALGFGTALAGTAVAGVLLLDLATSGGYLSNTVDALVGASGWANLWSTLSDSQPVQWVPIVAVVAIGTRRRLRAGFPEIYLLASAGLHTAAMLKTGSSVNYLLEPTFALLLLAALRAAEASPAPDVPAGGRRAPLPEPRPARLLSAGLLAAVLVAPAAYAGARELPAVRGWMASTGPRVADFEGYPLVDPMFFPAVLERHGRPWLNDPFAFGALEEVDRWDPRRLVDDIVHRRVPFALTTADMEGEPVPPEGGTRELVMAYFWRSRPIWSALAGTYERSSSGPLTVWLPRDDPGGERDPEP